MKLISMTDFVLSRDNSRSNSEEALHEITQYANFLKQPLKLEMFVPCDDNGNILDDPGLIPSYELEQYRKAKEKVLFEGCLLQKFKDEPELKIISFKRQCVWVSYNTNLKIEDITHYDLELTQNAIKQFL